MGKSHDYFSSKSNEYASFRPTYPDELIEVLAGFCKRKDLALDVGCGSGQLSVLLTKRFRSVIALDLSEEQIKRAAGHPAVTYRVAQAERTGLRNHTVDLITAAQAAHWFHFENFYKEAFRVLKGKGLLALITYGVVETDGEVGILLSHIYHKVLSPFWPAERRYVEDRYANIPFPLTEIKAPALAMRAHWSVRRLVGYMNTWSAVRNAETTLGEEAVAKVFSQLIESAGPADPILNIRWPLSLRIGHV